MLNVYLGKSLAKVGGSGNLEKTVNFVYKRPPTVLYINCLDEQNFWVAFSTSRYIFGEVKQNLNCN